MPKYSIDESTTAFLQVFSELKAFWAFIPQIVLATVAQFYGSTPIPWWVWFLAINATLVVTMFEAFHRLRSAKDRVISLEQARLDAVTLIVKDVAASLGQCNADIDPNSNPTPNLTQLRTSLSDARRSLETAIKHAEGGK